MNIRLKLLI